MYGHTAVVEKLLAAGVNADYSVGDNQEAPLLLAVQNGHFEVVKTLIAGGADVNITNANGSNALHYAAEQSYNEDIINLLLDNNINIAQQDKWCETPLFNAVRNRQLELGEKLIELETNDFTAKNKDELTPLNFAIEKGCKDFISSILNKMLRKASWPHRLMLNFVAIADKNTNKRY